MHPLFRRVAAWVGFTLLPLLLISLIHAEAYTPAQLPCAPGPEGGWICVLPGNASSVAYAHPPLSVTCRGVGAYYNGTTLVVNGTVIPASGVASIAATPNGSFITAGAVSVSLPPAPCLLYSKSKPSGVVLVYGYTPTWGLVYLGAVASGRGVYLFFTNRSHVVAVPEGEPSPLIVDVVDAEGRVVSTLLVDARAGLRAYPLPASAARLVVKSAGRIVVLELPAPQLPLVKSTTTVTVTRTVERTVTFTVVRRVYATKTFTVTRVLTLKPPSHTQTTSSWGVQLGNPYLVLALVGVLAAAVVAARRGGEEV